MTYKKTAKTTTPLRGSGVKQFTKQGQLDRLGGDF